MWDQGPGTVPKKKNRKQKPYGCEVIQSWCAVISVNCVVARVIDTVTGMSKKNKNTIKYNVSTKEKKQTPTHPYARTPGHPRTHTNTDVHTSKDTTAPMPTPRQARTGAPTPARARTPTHTTRPRTPTSGGWFSFLCCSGFRYLRLVQ